MPGMCDEERTARAGVIPPWLFFFLPHFKTFMNVNYDGLASQPYPGTGDYGLDYIFSYLVKVPVRGHVG